MINEEQNFDDDKERNTSSLLYFTIKRSLFIVKELINVKRLIKRRHLSFSFLLKV